MKRWLNEERELQIVAMYEKYKTAREVAAELGTSLQTVYRTLEKHGVKRTGRRKSHKKQPKLFVSHCRSKYCPALVVMLHKEFGWNAKKIASEVGYAENATRNILSKHGLVLSKPIVRKADVDLDTMECEYLNGATTYELGVKYGVDPNTISKWMISRGIRLGKGAHQKGRHGRSGGDFVYSDKMKELNNRKHVEGEHRFAERIQKVTDGRFEYVSDFRKDGRLIAKIRCTKCGHEFMHTTDLKKDIKCPNCTERQRQQRKKELEEEREAKRYERMFSEIREFALVKTCAECGAPFQNASPDAKYCCKACSSRARSKRRPHYSRGGGFRHYYHVKYGDQYLEHYDPSVTLKALYKRDGGVCQICGEPCDWHDKSWGRNGPMYPSIDHIVARANGGDHHWDNVQLVHCICNSYKRDLTNEEAMARG